MGDITQILWPSVQRHIHAHLICPPNLKSSINAQYFVLQCKKTPTLFVLPSFFDVSAPTSDKVDAAAATAALRKFLIIL